MLDKIFDYLKSNPRFNNKPLAITLCGGEVFLNHKKAFQFVKHFLQRIQDFKIHHILIITNGYELDKFLPLLINLDKTVIYNITIDGLPRVHNKRRYLANGKNTFNKIIDNIRKIVDNTKHNVTIRTNLDDENFELYPEFINYLNDIGLLNNSQITIYPTQTTDYVYEEKQNSHLPKFKKIPF